MRYFLAYATLTLVLAGCSAGYEPSLSDKLDTYFAERYPRPDEPGGAVIIARGDSIIYERYFGVADMATGERVDSATRFNIASVSKQFTVAGVMQTGVDIDRPVCDFEPWPQPFWHEVTLRHLASHTSGVPDSRDRSDLQRCIEATDASSIEYFPAIDSLKFAPGTAYDYLNPSFLILAQVVEQQRGMEFVKAQQKYIFEPAGMSSTFYYEPDTVAPHMAHGYEPVDGNWQEYDYGEETFSPHGPTEAYTPRRATCSAGNAPSHAAQCSTAPRWPRHTARTSTCRQALGATINAARPRNMASDGLSTSRKNTPKYTTPATTAASRPM